MDEEENKEKDSGIEKSCFLPLGSLNELRRKAVEGLKDKILA